MSEAEKVDAELEKTEPETDSMLLEDNVDDGPVVKHNDFPELTLRAVLLGTTLSVLLGAANVYLGLLVGLTVSASIPASVMSLSLLKSIEGLGFSKTNVLENNIVQTIASAGEALAAGVIFTVPGLVIINKRKLIGEEGYEDAYSWDSFLGSNYIIVTVLALFGGVMGIMFSIPIRRALIVELVPKLKFPEGLATSKVLLSGDQGGKSVLAVACGALMGALVQALNSIALITESLSGGFFINKVAPIIFQLYSKPALFAVGYIVGPNIGSVLMLGASINYYLAIPIRAAVLSDYGNTTITAVRAAGDEFGSTRYIGVGLMVVGGIWALITVRRPIADAVRFSIRTLRSVPADIGVEVPRYEKDLDSKLVLVLLGSSMLAIYLTIGTFAEEYGKTIILVLISIILAFLFSAVAAYMAGLVGSSNNPVSGVTICSALVMSLIVLALFGDEDPKGPAMVVLLACAICCACAISGDNMQDLACGHILGSTPRSQQIGMVFGVSAASFLVAPILELLEVAEGIGLFEDENGDLRGYNAPQASVISSLPVGIIYGTLEYEFIAIGIAFGVVVILVDSYLGANGYSWRIPALALAVSIYLPISYIVPIFLGGLIHLVIGTTPENSASEGILYSAGLIAGESLTAIILAIPIVATGDGGVLEVFVNETDGTLRYSDEVFYFPIPLALVLLGSIAYFAKVQPFTGGQISTVEKAQNLAA